MMMICVGVGFVVAQTNIFRPSIISNQSNMADDCWGAFGSDSDADDSVDNGEQSKSSFDPAADALALAITQHFISLTKSTGVSYKDRVVGVGSNYNNDHLEACRRTVMERVGGRGMKVVESYQEMYDASILLMCKKDNPSGGEHLKRNLLPGGVLWLVVILEIGDSDDAVSLSSMIKDYSDAIWDIDSASKEYSSSNFIVISLQKRACVINAWSCPWMDKQQRIRNEIPTLVKNPVFDIAENETYLQYERKVASAVTITPSVAECTRNKIDSKDGLICITTLTDANVQRAADILEEHGVVVIKKLLPPSQTVQWGKAVLDDFNSAVSRLKCHPTRKVDLMNPQGNNTSDTFEPLSYKEMAMREDLRVDLRSGPEMESLRASENELAQQTMAEKKRSVSASNNYGPTIVTADNEGTIKSWRFHPSILKIIKTIFNPKDDAFALGNFGRWNFGGTGPDGTPQPFRLGQIGSVLSCPGSGDQAVHADTPHLFEHVDCLPCHYLNVFTPGYMVNDCTTNCYYRNEFSDGIWTGNSTLGGTAFVQGSHKLSVTAELLSESEDTTGEDNTALIRKQLLQLRTLRPALDAGDVLLFDCRTIHYGLANTSQGDTTGKDIDAGRRPMLYLNVSQAWFHDPKNWDDRDSIFK